jgi:hypothetical protein
VIAPRPAAANRFSASISVLGADYSGACGTSGAQGGFRCAAIALVIQAAVG